MEFLLSRRAATRDITSLPSTPSHSEIKMLSLNRHRMDNTGSNVNVKRVNKRVEPSPSMQQQQQQHQQKQPCSQGVVVRPRRFRLSKEKSIPNIPQLGIFNNNHVLVNRERAMYHLSPYRRSKALDELARLHARYMADNLTVRHSVSSISELRFKLESDHVAENVQSGDSIKQMHDFVMADRRCSYENILGNFVEFGMATAKGADGKLYLCQLFRR